MPKGDIRSGISTVALSPSPSSTHKRCFARQNNPDFGELPGSCDFLREYVDLAGGRVQGLLQIDLEALVLGAGTMVDEIEAIAGSRG